MHFDNVDTGKNYIGITERKRKKLGRIDRESVGSQHRLTSIIYLFSSKHFGSAIYI